MVIRVFTRVRPKRVLLWADAYNGYGCNPRAISDYLLGESNHHYEIYWVFNNPTLFNTDQRIKLVKYGTLDHILLVNTSEFLITNHRTDPTAISWKKRKGQKYIMTWHGSMGVKKAGADKQRSKNEIRIARMDSSICDVMLSDSQWYDNIIKTQLEYFGPVLRKGTPRNEIYYDENKICNAKRKVVAYYSIGSETKIVMYAPTFRNDYSFDAYFKEWDVVREYLREMLGGDIVIVLRYHQVMKRFNAEALGNRSGFINATDYDNMQELLCASDLLITDYSSTMFDMGILRKPCILYASDIDKYDRGFYFDLKKLPMPLAENTQDLQRIIKNFNMEKYQKEMEFFYSNVLKLYPDHNACESFLNWMEEKSIKKIQICQI